MAKKKVKKSIQIPKEKYDVEKRWSKELTTDGWVPISHFFLENYHRLKPYDLTHNEAMFVVHLFRYKWDENAPYPGYKTIAKHMGISDKSARRYAQSLEQKGYLHREMRKGETNKFHLKNMLDALKRSRKAQKK